MKARSLMGSGAKLELPLCMLRRPHSPTCTSFQVLSLLSNSIQSALAQACWWGLAELLSTLLLPIFFLLSVSLCLAFGTLLPKPVG